MAAKTIFLASMLLFVGSILQVHGETNNDTDVPPETASDSMDQQYPPQDLEQIDRQPAVLIGDTLKATTESFEVDPGNSAP